MSAIRSWWNAGYRQTDRHFIVGAPAALGAWLLYVTGGFDSRVKFRVVKRRLSRVNRLRRKLRVQFLGAHDRWIREATEATRREAAE